MTWPIERRYKVTGRPLPKGMSPCIVGFYVSKRRQSN